MATYLSVYGLQKYILLYIPCEKELLGDKKLYFSCLVFKTLFQLSSFYFLEGPLGSAVKESILNPKTVHLPFLWIKKQDLGRKIAVSLCHHDVIRNVCHFCRYLLIAKICKADFHFSGGLH